MNDSGNFPSLGGPNPYISEKGPADLDIVKFLQPSYMPIKNLTPTAWGGHIPFMFSVVAALRPRRFVELGTHCGASFFAACQSIISEEIPCEAVAIDLWTGDHQAGFYDEEVFNNFKWIMQQNYNDIGHFIRLDFDSSVERFEDNSIDMLHIDGLHTYEAVKNDYETWKPKLTSNATVLFHDTNVHRDDFGVFKYWDEIKDTTDSFNFLHTHGLGVLAFGGAQKNPAAHLIAHIEKHELGEFVETHYSRLGKLACDEALARIMHEQTERTKQAANTTNKKNYLLRRIKNIFKTKKA